MPDAGWKSLLDGWPWFQGEGGFPLWPNSEFMPPVRLGRKPYGTWDATPFRDDDPWGWPVTEYEEHLALRPGLRRVGAELLHGLRALCRGEGTAVVDEFAAHKLRDNPYWPGELAGSPALERERFVLLLPLALSITQDDKAHVPWTLFGGSEQGPARAFWRSFFTAPGVEVPAETGLAFFRTLLAGAYEEPAAGLADLRAAGFRVLPLAEGEGSFTEGPLPSWTAPLLLGEKESLARVRYLLTFRPFAELPRRVRSRYREGELHLLPFPGSLLFWGIPSYHELRASLPFALQVPLLHFVERHLGVDTVRVPQAGWFREAGPASRPAADGRGPFRETYRRTHRTARVHRETADLVQAHEHRLAHVLFSTRPRDIDLYHKPMGRNVQLWDHDFRLLLDGPCAGPDDIRRAAEAVAGGGTFGYRFQFPAHRVGRHELYWHRPLVAYSHPRTNKTVVLPAALLGYLTAYREGAADFAHPVELWPRLLDRPAHAANVAVFHGHAETVPGRTLNNVRKILHAADLWASAPLPRSFARALLTAEKGRSLDGWIRSLPRASRRAEAAKGLAVQVEAVLAPPGPDEPPPSALTYAATATRAFEEDYWNTIARLSSNDYPNKNNADCVLDPPTQAALRHHERDLDALGTYLLDQYAALLTPGDRKRGALAGELPFRWDTQYAFPWMGGWQKNQDGQEYERNLLVVIPGRDRGHAVIMADHYDTAYMYDHYEKRWGGTGARLAAPGADDNCSATAALLLGARSFLELSRQGRLGCDIWLVHLTGEEYPAEGLGACRLCQWLVERTLKMRTPDGAWHDLSGTRVRGLYVLDMIAHNNNKDRNVFQISPGVSRESLWLAYQAHLATRVWNASADTWNASPERRDAPAGRRSRTGKLPPVAPHAKLHGEVRLPFDPRSTLFNTDGQGFSDVGVPVVLFMENYDINRVGYHDSHDDMRLINLDYGAALAAITIESVARAATQEMPARFARA